MTWVPILRGYPDAGAAVMMALAVCLYLRDLELQDRMTVWIVGALLALSVVLRRHFAYAVVAFLVAAVVQALIVGIFDAQPAGERVRRLVLRVLRVAMVPIASAIVALMVAHAYVRRLIAFDFTVLYRSYEQSLGTVLWWYVSPYGWLAWWLAAAGWLLGLASHRVRRSGLAFVLLWDAVLAAQRPDVDAADAADPRRRQPARGGSRWRSAAEPERCAALVASRDDRRVLPHSARSFSED
jgi:hypothetical protein